MVAINTSYYYLCRSALPRDADDGVVGPGREGAADLRAGRLQAAPLPAGQARPLRVALGQRVAPVAGVARHRTQVRRPVHVAEGGREETRELKELVS